MDRHPRSPCGSQDAVYVRSEIHRSHFDGSRLQRRDPVPKPCLTRVVTEREQALAHSPAAQLTARGSSPKSYAVAVVLSAIFGMIGVQHFYLRRWGEGILDVFLSSSWIYAFAVGKPIVGAAFFGLDLLHTVVVTYLLLVGKFKDGDGNLVRYPGQRAPDDQTP